MALGRLLRARLSSSGAMCLCARANSKADIITLHEAMLPGDWHFRQYCTIRFSHRSLRVNLASSDLVQRTVVGQAWLQSVRLTTASRWSRRTSGTATGMRTRFVDTCTAFASFPHSDCVFGLLRPQVGWLISGCAAAVTCGIALITILGHARNYTRPLEQRQIIRVLLFAPVFAVVSFLSYRFFRSYTY